MTNKKTNIFTRKMAQEKKIFQPNSSINLELKLLERRSLYLRHPGMSLHPTLKGLGRLPDFLIPKMTRRLCSETISTSLPMGILCIAVGEKIKSYNGSNRPKIIAQSKHVWHHWMHIFKGFPLVQNLVLWGFSRRGKRPGSSPDTNNWGVYGQEIRDFFPD